MMSISRSTASLETTSSAVELSRSSKLDRLSKAYSLTDLTARTRRRTASSESSYNRETASSRSKSQIGDEDIIKERTISRITKNIEKDRNADKKFTAAYREKWKGVMNQTATRTETKKRDSALLSGSTKPRLPSISDSNKLSAGNPRQTGANRNNRAAGNGPRARSGRPDLETGGRNAASKLDTRARSRSSKPDLATGARSSRADNTASKPAVKSNRAEERGPKKTFSSAVNKAAPSKTLAGTVKRATNAAQRGKPVDDFALNKKYSDSVCEPCKLQIHEKLKRGYAKYKSLDTMKACEKCKRVVIDFDFYQICIECAKSTAVCAKCAAGSTKMTGARFVEVVRNGVEENILAMNSNELKKFAEKHAKIDVVERKIDDIEQLGVEDPRLASHPNSRKASGKSTRGNSGSRASSSTSNSPATRKLASKLNTDSPISTRSTSSKAAQIARSLTSSSSPLVDKEAPCQSGNESDEAYASGHISSTDVVKSASNPNKRNRKKSSDILRQIRSLSNLEVTSPTLARSVIREIRSLTAIDTDEEEGLTDGDLAEEAEEAAEDHTAEDNLYTPFSCDKSLDGDLETFIVESPVVAAGVETTPEEEITIPEERMRSSKSGQLEDALSVEDYFPSPTTSPIPTVRSLSNVSETLSEVKSVKESSSPSYNDDYSEVKHRGKSGKSGKNMMPESDEEFWVEDVELFEDSEIEYSYKTERVDVKNKKKPEVSLVNEGLIRDEVIESSVKDYTDTETEEELETEEGDMVEHVHIEAEKHDSPNLNGNSDPDLNLDLRLTESEFTDVIEIEHEAGDLTPRNEKYGSKPCLDNDIHVIDFMDETPRSAISENGHDDLELDPPKSKRGKKDKISVEPNSYSENLHVYDFDERSSSCEDMESRSGDHGGHDADIILKSGVKPKLSDLICQDSPSHHEDGDRPSSLTVVKGSPEDAVMGESDHVFNRPFGRTEYERQNGQVFSNGGKTDADAIIDKISEGFEQFVQYHQDHTFEVVEGNHDYEQEDGYYECYQYPYNPRLRIRLEDIPEEGTLSKETTYLSTVYNETFDKEDTMYGRGEADSVPPAPLTRDPTMEEHAVDIVSSALHNAVIQVESCREPSR